MLCEGILITIMVIGIIPSILMILPYPEKYRREKQYRENREKTKKVDSAVGRLKAALKALNAKAPF